MTMTMMPRRISRISSLQLKNQSSGELVDFSCKTHTSINFSIGLFLLCCWRVVGGWNYYESTNHIFSNIVSFFLSSSILFAHFHFHLIRRCVTRCRFIHHHYPGAFIQLSPPPISCHILVVIPLVIVPEQNRTKIHFIHLRDGMACLVQI